MTERRRNSLVISLRMQQHITKAAAGYADLMAVSGLSRESVEHWTRQMRQAGSVYVESYEPDERGRYCMPMFRFGVGEDAERPKPKLTNAQRQAAYRVRKKGLEP